MTTQAIIESGMTFGPYPVGQSFYIEKSQCYQHLQEGVQIAEFLLLRQQKDQQKDQQQKQQQSGDGQSKQDQQQSGEQSGQPSSQPQDAQQGQGQQQNQELLRQLVGVIVVHFPPAG